RRTQTLRARGENAAQIQRSLAAEYGADRWSAERLVRGSFNTAANTAHMEGLERAGFERQSLDDLA
ncbi:MAG: hypothetical protein HC933_23055, partial [Pleurocapsa sp. SU_196_0]|nr:hypothetical protein [Pleurocapsa sp. SU_196_0]